MNLELMNAAIEFDLASAKAYFKLRAPLKGIRQLGRIPKDVYIGLFTAPTEFTPMGIELIKRSTKIMNKMQKG